VAFDSGRCSFRTRISTDKNLRIKGSRWIPLGEVEARVGELSDWKEHPIVVHCHHGGRSARACERLREAGFRRVANLAGGIEAWSLTVDPDVPRY
jgi:rhodanese-related sulfurtransferase